MTAKEVYGKLMYFCNICDTEVHADNDGNLPPICQNCYEEEKEVERHAEESKHYAEQ